MKLHSFDLFSRKEHSPMKMRLLCTAMLIVLLTSLIPTALAESRLDHYAIASFGQNYAVYSGPGEYYYRANSGKALYGGGSARVYGVVGDWVMIGYQLTNGDFRIGYIKNGLESMTVMQGSVNYTLTFDSYTAWADGYCRLTDDPVVSNKMIYTIPEGAPVTVLATMGNAWTYVEVASASGYMRGFVWSMHLVNEAGKKIAASTPSPDSDAFTAPAVTPIRHSSNTYYHDAKKGELLPVYGELHLEGSWPVYSGPGEYYYRANDGKATMGGGYCRIYGVENGWAMIGYGLSNGRYRIGYVSLDAIPQQSLNLPYLDLRYTTRQLQSAADLTDDTVRFRSVLVTLPAQTYVLFLGYVYDLDTTWAYVEVLAGDSIMRGFIPASALNP